VTWMIVFLVIGGALALGRIAMSLNQLRKRKVDDWDTKLIERLRRSGTDPFAVYEIDFFLAMPSEEVAHRVAQTLSTEGFSTGVRPVADSSTHPFSVHALRSMQLNADGIHAISSRLREIAASTGGRYDGWAPGKAAPRPA
jgi:regulator of RNase E activity RraB